jgi:ubiquinone/menaquinone biosynthesis C-methylase UbiE
MPLSPTIQRWIEPQVCCDPEWEAAYARFETPEQETAKFRRRLRRLGVSRWRRDLQVVEIFCGHGNGLKAWGQLGFGRLEGVDLSESLLGRYSGSAQLYVGDCRSMAFPDASRDVICVQGGLHHLPVMPGDLHAVVAEVRRVLRPGGRFVVVEPWLTPFLRGVHWLYGHSLVRRISARIDALASMNHREERTYFQWLSRPREIRMALRQGFASEREQIGWGKLLWIGRK